MFLLVLTTSEDPRSGGINWSGDGATSSPVAGSRRPLFSDVSVEDILMDREEEEEEGEEGDFTEEDGDEESSDQDEDEEEMIGDLRSLKGINAEYREHLKDRKSVV